MMEDQSGQCHHHTSRQNLKNDMMDKIQIWLIHVTGPQGVLYR